MNKCIWLSGYATSHIDASFLLSEGVMTNIRCSANPESSICLFYNQADTAFWRCKPERLASWHAS